MELYSHCNQEHHHFSIDHVFDALQINLYHCLIVCSIDVQLEPEATPFVEGPDIEPRQQGKQTPLIMSIKSQFPLSLAYACLGDHLVSILPHSSTHIRCMTYHLVTVVSKPQS